MAEKQKWLEFAEKDKLRTEERIKLEFENKLALNLQLAEERQKNMLRHTELMGTQLQHVTTGVAWEEPSVPLLIDVGDSSQDVVTHQHRQRVGHNTQRQLVVVPHPWPDVILPLLVCV